MRNKNFPPSDPDLKIPDAVKAAGAAAEELHNQIYTTQSDDPPPPPETPVEKPNDPPLTAQPPAQTPPVTQQVTDDGSWEHRYNSMKGRFERAQQQLSQQNERLSAMERTFAAMQANTSERPSGELKAERLLTQEEEEEYGSDFLSVVAKKAREELLPEIRQRDVEIASLKSQLKGVGNYVAQDAFGRMTESLDKTVPNWREQNVNPEFIQWLSLPDPYSGDIRHNMLKAAWERQDAPRVAAFFKGFLAEEAAVSPANSGQVPAPAAGKIPLENFAAPGRAKTAAASNAPAEKPVITSAQIAKFYADAAAGRYNGRDEEKLRFEKMIFEAQREGRIR